MIRFDTLKYFEILKEAGIPEDQCRAQIEVLEIALESSDIATKTDILELKTDISELKTEFKTNTLLLKVELIMWMFGMGFSIVGIMFVILRLMLPY